MGRLGVSYCGDIDVEDNKSPRVLVDYSRRFNFCQPLVRVSLRVVAGVIFVGLAMSPLSGPISGINFDGLWTTRSGGLVWAVTESSSSSQILPDFQRSQLLNAAVDTSAGSSVVSSSLGSRSVKSVKGNASSSVRGAQLRARRAGQSDFGRFVISEKSSPADWRYFKASSLDWKKGLWDYHTSLGRTLSSWHWAWRMAWVQACHHRDHLQDRRCQDILIAAEQDRAVVVRAEVVRVYRELFTGSGSRDIVARLKAMFANPRNYRSGRPLYIAKNIIYAVAQVGDQPGSLESLAASHPELASYYNSFHRGL